ncbi:hypothetical protein BDV95DRAFT_558236 [Massariosphaeria phaeospora]|uniref:Uncharacterized protein n=1 Tax=Massariosphaeria phaeospora TaxID=100035 RepID=A0A7C8IDJ3_9PLEO|nr:hypothetical protein BDV95DRAFT_558236 [Massariosphaeria phaeospora]
MRLVNIACGALGICKMLSQPAIVERLDVTTIVTEFVATPTTVTVSKTVGVIASPIVHRPPPLYMVPSSNFYYHASPEAGAFPGLLPGTPSWPRELDMDLGVPIFAFGEWLQTPINITPYEILRAVFIFMLAASFWSFTRDGFNVYYMMGIINSVLRAWHMGSCVLWTVVWYLVANLTNDGSTIFHMDPMHGLIGQLTRYAAIEPTTPVLFLLWATRWFAQGHWFAGRHVLVAMWMEIRPGLHDCYPVLLKFLHRGAAHLPTLLDSVLSSVASAAWYLGRALRFLGGIAHPIRPICRVFWYVVLKAGQRPLTWLCYLVMRWESTLAYCAPSEPYWQHWQRAATLTLHQRITLIYTVRSLESALDRLSFHFTPAVGAQAVSYRASLLAAIDDLNYYRAVIDAIGNYKHNRDTGKHPIFTETVFASPTITFSAVPNDAGFHYNVPNRTAHTYNTYDNPGSSSALLLRGNMARPRPRQWGGVARLPAHLDVFASEHWAFGDLFPGLRVPSLRAAQDPFAQKNRVVVKDVAAKFGRLVEDRAVRGEGKKWALGDELTVV